MSRWTRHAVGVAAVVVLVPVAPIAGHAAGGVPCDQVVAAPAFSTSKTAFCARLVRDGTNWRVEVWRTRDAGRTWQPTAAAGLAAGARDTDVALLVSTEYRADRAMYVGLNGSGTFRSTDDGESFLLVDPTGSGLAGVSRTLGGPTPAPELTRGAIAVALQGVSEGSNRSFLLDPPLPRQPVTGTPALDLTYASAPDRPTTVVAAGASGAGMTYQVTFYECTAAFACPVKLGALPARHFLERVWLSPRFVTDRTIVVRATNSAFKDVFFRSTDGGRTFSVLKPLQRLVDTMYGNGAVPTADLAAAVVNGTTTYYLRLVHFASRSRIPAHQVYRSTDGGNSWTRTAASTGPRTSALPPPSPTTTGLDLLAPIAATPSAVFLTSGNGLLCSTDRGVRWTVGCRR